MRVERAAAELRTRRADATTVLPQQADGRAIGVAERRSHDATREERDRVSLVAYRRLVTERVGLRDPIGHQRLGVAKLGRDETQPPCKATETRALIDA